MRVSPRRRCQSSPLRFELSPVANRRIVSKAAESTRCLKERYYYFEISFYRETGTGSIAPAPHSRALQRGPLTSVITTQRIDPLPVGVTVFLTRRPLFFHSLQKRGHPLYAYIHFREQGPLDQSGGCVSGIARNTTGIKRFESLMMRFGSRSSLPTGVIIEWKLKVTGRA